MAASKSKRLQKAMEQPNIFGKSDVNTDLAQLLIEEWSLGKVTPQQVQRIMQAAKNVTLRKWAVHLQQNPVYDWLVLGAQAHSQSISAIEIYNNFCRYKLIQWPSSNFHFKCKTGERGVGTVWQSLMLPHDSFSAS